METDSRYSWIRLVVTLAIAAIINVGMWAVIMVLPQVQAEFGVSRADASLPYTATMIGFALGNMAMGRVVDRHGVTLALLGAVALFAAASVAAALAPSIWWLTTAQFAIGLGTAAGFGPLMADISHWFRRFRGVAVAIVASGNYLSGAIWPVLLSGLLAEEGWRAVYLALAAIALVIVVPLSLFLRHKISAGARAVANADVAARAGRMPFTPRQLQILLAAAGVGCCVAMSMPQVHIVALSVDLGFGSAVGAEMLSLMLFGGVVSRLVSGLLFDRLGGLVTVLIGSGLQCLALFLYLPAQGLASLYVVSLVFGLSQGGIVPGYAVIVRDYLPAEEAGARVGFVIMMTILGMALGGWMSGWIYDVTGSYEWAFWNGILWNLGNLAILGTLFWTTTRRGRVRGAPA
ncbi:CynX/NimT family MFS transporter [Pseudaestuariivita atlantica]|uniref:MFS transporter n=1 Tax=Pseudaestuariivita atlantica TaxID=1317121 RepID=A0A0L1JQS5_9RHOB|nr:MFS transporter [Pseudaestuariivita atlantica]KNG93763.1 MFS transporter [Pseudaestuariivita atlantica]